MSKESGFEALSLRVEHICALERIDARAWNHLLEEDYPFLRHEFLSALEESGCVTETTGWQPQHLLVWHDHAEQGSQLVAAVPLYLKQHSWGEYVFDQQWANAYAQVGMSYYPKLLTAIPYTPCAGPRLLKNTAYLQQIGCDMPSLSHFLVDQIKAACRQLNCSSWHLLFPDQATVSMFRDMECDDEQLIQELSCRHDIQFQWFNQGFTDFDAFLADLTAKNRKKIKRERRKIAESHIRLQRLTGSELTDNHWQVFYQFYAATYLKRGRRPYLSLSCFLQWADTMQSRLLLVMAYVDLGEGSKPVAAALSFVSHDTLYGRYWGCLEEYDSLHYETCYYQGIEFCIEQGIKRFDSGAQGEHKIARGFRDQNTYSLHWLAHPEFREAVARFVREEQQGVSRYQQAVQLHLPFKQQGCDHLNQENI